MHESVSQQVSDDRDVDKSTHRASRRRRQDPAQVDRTRRIHIAILLFAALWAYVTALSGGFIWDDDRDLLQGGQRLLSSEDLGRFLHLSNEQYRLRLDGGIPADATGAWQPAVILNYTLSWALFGDCAPCHHLENLLWHALVVVGLYALGRHLLNLRRHSKTVAFWAALGFAVHPLGVSSVAWIGARPVLLSTALAVWCLVLLTRLPATSKSHRQHINRWLLGIGATLLLALGAEERGYLIPLAALLIAWFETRERGRKGLRGISRQRRMALAGVIVMVAAAIVYRSFHFGFPGLDGGYPSADWSNNLGTAVRLFWAQMMAVIVPSEPIVSDAFPITKVWGGAEFASLLGILLVLAATVYGLKRRHPLSFGVMWYLIWSLPGMGLLPQQRYYDETSLYPAYWGLMLGLAYVLFRLWRPLGRQMIRGSESIVFGPIVLLLLILTASSNVRWHSDSTLFESEINNDPQYREGRVMLAKAALHRGQPESALKNAMVVEASRKDQTFTGFIPEYQHQMLLGRAQLALGMADAARLSFAQAVAINPVSARARLGLANSNLALGELARAKASLRTAQAIWPQHPDVQVALARIRLAEQSYQEARTLLRQAMNGGRRDPEVRTTLAQALFGLELYEEAARELGRASADRDRPEIRAHLAWAFWKLQRHAEARAELRGIDRSRLTRILPTAQWLELSAGLDLPETSAAEAAVNSRARPEPAPAGESVEPAR